TSWCARSEAISSSSSAFCTARSSGRRPSLRLNILRDRSARQGFASPLRGRRFVAPLTRPARSLGRLLLSERHAAEPRRYARILHHRTHERIDFVNASNLSISRSLAEVHHDLIAWPRR